MPRMSAADLLALAELVPSDEEEHYPTAALKDTAPQALEATPPLAPEDEPEPEPEAPSRLEDQVPEAGPPGEAAWDAEEGALPADADSFEATESGSDTSELCQPILMTVGTWTGMRLVYGRRQPRCYACGRLLRVGEPWRWFVLPRQQPFPFREDPVPAFGCAEGHEGALIEVAGTVFLIGPPGEAATPVAKL